MRLLKLSVIMAAASMLTLVHAAESKKAAQDKPAQSAAPAVSEGNINLTVTGMT